MMPLTSLHFTKMHGLGNDFVIINALTKPINLQTVLITHLANRYTGIGFDQLLIIEPSSSADFFCRIYNADGSLAAQCGNGLRCVARYLHEKGIHNNKHITIETVAGIFPITINDYDHIRVSMGKPEIDMTDTTLPIHIISLGNPHAIMNVETIDSSSLASIATQIATHSHFPDGVNVGFMQIIDKHHIRLRTFERGAGETFACGSNACAAVIAGIIQGLLEKEVSVAFAYGSLTIAWGGDDEPVYMTGPASRVYEGEITIE